MTANCSVNAKYLHLFLKLQMVLIQTVHPHTSCFLFYYERKLRNKDSEEKNEETKLLILHHSTSK